MFSSNLEVVNKVIIKKIIGNTKTINNTKMMYLSQIRDKGINTKVARDKGINIPKMDQPAFLI